MPVVSTGPCRLLVCRSLKPLSFPRSSLFCKDRAMSTRAIRQETRAQRFLLFGSGHRPCHWGGGLPREGVVAEKFVLALESLSFFFFFGFRREESGISLELCGMSQTLVVFNKFVLKKFVRIFRSLSRDSLCLSACTYISPYPRTSRNQIRHKNVRSDIFLCLDVLSYKQGVY